MKYSNEMTVFMHGMKRDDYPKFTLEIFLLIPFALFASWKGYI